MTRLCILSLLLSVATQRAMGSESMAATDSTARQGNKIIQAVKRVMDAFDDTDDMYVERPQYECAVEFRATRNYENFILNSEEQSIMFSPDQPIKVGPYFSWRWMSIGTTFDLKKISLFDNSTKREFDFSFYSARVGADLFYRHTGNDYKLRNVQIGKNVDGTKFEDVPFDGITVGVVGANAYYIFNHRRFSYPAAFSTGSRQKISCGSWLAGVGHTRNTLDLDFDKLESLLREHTDDEIKLDSSMMFHRVEYNDFNVSTGYAHTWVLTRDLTLSASGQAALAYKNSHGRTDDEGYGINFGKVNLDGIGRFAVAYNNMRWYAGACIVLRTNNYHTSHFATSNIYGTFNAYIGYNFILKKEYRKK